MTKTDKITLVSKSFNSTSVQSLQPLILWMIIWDFEPIDSAPNCLPGKQK